VLYRWYGQATEDELPLSQRVGTLLGRLEEGGREAHGCDRSRVPLPRRLALPPLLSAPLTPLAKARTPRRVMFLAVCAKPWASLPKFGGPIAHVDKGRNASPRKLHGRWVHGSPLIRRDDQCSGQDFPLCLHCPPFSSGATVDRSVSFQYQMSIVMTNRWRWTVRSWAVAVQVD